MTNLPTVDELPDAYEPGHPAASGLAAWRNARLVLRERKWYVISIFLVTFAAGLIYTFSLTPVYTAAATVQVLKRTPLLLRTVDMVDSNVASETDFNTQIKVLDSITLLQNVANRLSPAETRRLMAPYVSAYGGPLSPVEVIARHRTIVPLRLSLVVSIEVEHPDPLIAARVANLIATEYISYNSQVRIDEALGVVDKLKERANEQRKRVDEIALAEQSFRENSNLVSLAQNRDIVTEKLKALNMMATETQGRLRDAEIRWKQVQEWQRLGHDLTELPFIATQTKVTELILQLTKLKLESERLSARYNPKHPQMVEAVEAVKQAQAEMDIALQQAAASVRSEYENARSADQAARAELATQEAKSLDLDKAGVQYGNLDREYRVNNELLEALLSRIRESSITGSMEMDTARIVDRAIEPLKPSSPHVGLNIGVAAFLGLLLGVGGAFFVAAVDDKVMSAYDIESVIGLPLLGTIPKLPGRRTDRPLMPVLSGDNRHVVEAFLSLYSTLRLAASAGPARLLMVSSTLPHEGKSFVAANLALTLAQQGHRTVLVDCDLRKPTAHLLFQLSNLQGVSNCLSAGTGLAGLGLREVAPQLDVITAGAPVRNSVQVLNSAPFSALVAELRQRYEWVIFDTPPVAAVTDALNLLPMVDGALYVMKFAGVDRRSAAQAIRRLATANKPLFGVVLNAVTAAAEADYYGRPQSEAVRSYLHTQTGDASLP